MKYRLENATFSETKKDRRRPKLIDEISDSISTFTNCRKRAHTNSCSNLRPPPLMKVLFVSSSSSSSPSPAPFIFSSSKYRAPIHRSNNLCFLNLYLCKTRKTAGASNSTLLRCAAQNMENASASASTNDVASGFHDGSLKKEAKLWGGRFEESVTDAVEKFTESISFDKALYKHDIMGSRAHASMLAHQGLISDSDRDSILQGLNEIERQIEAGEFLWRTDREDVHMNIEAALTDLVGEPAKKLHTARSRNDQVATDFRLWCRDAIDTIIACIKRLQVAMLKLAVRNKGLIIPGYTHLQRAQPVLVQHLLLAYIEQFERDLGRLQDCRVRLNFCPLGACALAGTGLPIDRFMTSSALGFTAPLRNSIDAVSDRDFVLEFLSANSIAAIHLSRLGEEWVLWASEEFGFITPSDSVSTGSSIMPQKKNPDPMELVRGKSARVVGDLVSLLVLCKGLPQAYNRDLQEDKEPVFDSVKAIVGMLEVSAEFAQNFTFNLERIQKALPAGHLDATTLADYLVKKGVPFRTSHDIAGRSVAMCVSRNCQLSDLSLGEMQTISPVIEKDVYDYLGVENAIKKFSSYGSTGSECVASQLDYWIGKLDINRDRLF